jgi:hypothetical protein
VQEEEIEEGEEEVQGEREQASAVSRLRTFGIAAICAGGLFGASATAAQATFTMTPEIDFATNPVAVGSSGTGIFTFTNDSTAGETALFIDRIVLEPSCRLPGDTPPCENREPGIFSIGNAVGVTGTSCQNLTFNVTLGTPPFGGSLEFSPPSAIPAMPPNASCVINFTYTALAVPTFDTQPAEPGVDTDQSALVRADSGGGPVDPAPPVQTPPVTNPVTQPPVTPLAPVPVQPAKKKCKKKKTAAALAKKCKKKK